MSLFFSLSLPAEDYELLWKQVTEDEVKDQPREKISHVKKVYQKAAANHDFAWQAKAWRTWIETETDLDPTYFTKGEFPRLDHSGPVEDALYHALLASAYLTMTDSEVTEGDANVQAEYRAKADSLFALSLSARDTLAATPVTGYEPLLTTGNDSRLFANDVLSLLLHFALDNAEYSADKKADLTADMAAFYRAHGNEEAWALLSLAHIRYQASSDDANLRLSDEAQREALQHLAEATISLEAGADIAAAYAATFTDKEAQLRYVRDALQRFPKSAQTSYFEGLAQNIMRMRCSVAVADNALAGRPIPLVIEADNADHCLLQVRHYEGYDSKHRLRTTGHLFAERRYTLGSDTDNQRKQAEDLPFSDTLHDTLSLAAGHYVFIAQVGDDEKSTSEVSLTSLRLFSFLLPDGKGLAQVVDNETGRPVEGAWVLTESKKGEKSHLVADANGEVTFEPSRYRRIAARHPLHDEDETSWQYVGGTPHPYQEQARLTSQLFTDRAIYRPTQTVHVAGMVYFQHGDTTHVVAGQSLPLSLYDANYQKIAETRVTSDAHGHYTHDFVLPEGRLLGRYQLRDSLSSTSIQVEEYKRPTFTVEASADTTVHGTYTFGDTLPVCLTAKTYAGVPLQGARVAYKIETARTDFWWWHLASFETLSEADTVTSSAGTVTVPLYLDPKKCRADEESREVICYRVTFYVTDLTGETESTTFDIRIAHQPFALRVETPEVYDLADKHARVTLKTQNAAGQPVACQGTYRLFRADQSDTDAPLFTDAFTADVPFALPALSAGTYRLVAEAAGRAGKAITTCASLSVFHSGKTRTLSPTLPKNETARFSTYFADDFLYAPSHEFSEEQDAVVYFSPKEGDLYLGYMLTSNDTLLYRHAVPAGREVYRLTIPYMARYGQGVNFVVWYVRHGHVCSKHLTFTYRCPEKALHLSWKTFRDRLHPGQTEQWVLQVRDAHDRPLSAASLIATLYDASLEALCPLRQSFSLSFPRHIITWNHSHSDDNSGVRLLMSGRMAQERMAQRSYNQLTPFAHRRWLDQQVMLAYGAPRMRTRTRHKLASLPTAMALEEAATNDVVSMEAPSLAAMEMTDVVETEVAEEATAAPTEETSSLRSDFAETAFFSSQLLSDEKGEVQIVFTLPESLTRWQFQGFAHSDAVDYGTISAVTVAQKDLMVQPNLPRFIREGDKASLATRLSNTSEKACKGTARLRLLRAETEEVVFDTTLPFALQAGETSSVTFSLPVITDCPLLICEVTGETATYSDGERRYLPVLPSRRYVTEAVPFYLLPTDSCRHVDLSSLFNHGSATTSQRRLTLQYTAAPEWTVIEALEGLQLPKNTCAPCYAAALYANEMAGLLASRIPGLQETLARQTAAPTSPLQDDTSLKEIALEASPWLAEALKEADQRAALLSLFNDTLRTERREAAVKALQGLQGDDGAFSWFEGMPANYYITLSTAQHLAALVYSPWLGDYTSPDLHTAKTMLLDAMRYLDQEELKEYKERLKHKEELVPSESTLHYLYLSAMMPTRTVSKECEKMRSRYLTEASRHIGSCTILGRARLAYTFQAFGYEKEAKDFLESAVQYSVTRAGYGRFYATDQAYYSWRDYRIPTQLAVMRALRTSPRADRDTLLHEMQLWLVREKQSQQWDNPLNTLEVTAFLLDGCPLSATTATEAHVIPAFSLDGLALHPTADTTRFLSDVLGYVKEEMDDSLLVAPAFSSLDVYRTPSTSPAQTIAWGALFAQYMEDEDKLHNATSGDLTLSYRLLTEDGTLLADSHDTSLPTATLSVGQRVTLRLSLTATRDLDFVTLRAPHPACFEPMLTHSGYQWLGGRGGYVARHDTSTEVFFDTFKRGTYTLDLPCYVDRSGSYLFGSPTAACAYAPEISTRAQSLRVVVY